MHHVSYHNIVIINEMNKKGILEISYFNNKIKW